jgi:arsenate reductase
MITVLFACVHNAGRSQIAAALFNKYADPSKARAISAGTQPADRVHPEVVEAMRSRGIDLSRNRPQKLTPELASTAAWLITMGCGDECPVVPGARRDDWPIQDPKGQAPDTVDAIIKDLDDRVQSFVRSSL